MKGKEHTTEGSKTDFFALEDVITIAEHNEDLGMTSDPWEAKLRLRLDRVESWHEAERDGQGMTAVVMFSGDQYILKIPIRRFDRIISKYGSLKLVRNG
jgi:hypothetical protein